jgi:hypothetical protein
MASELLALLAAGGLMAAGANPATETRSAQALPVGKFVAVSAPAKGPMGRCLVKPGKFGGKATVICGKQNLQAAVAGGIAGGLGGISAGVLPVVITATAVVGGVVAGVATGSQCLLPGR